MSTGPVSVIIAARNAENTIAQAVKSSLGQPEVGEVIIVDDASTDATASVAMHAADGDARLKVLRQDVNIGPAAARNAAIAASGSPFISIVDADDYVLDGRYANLLSRSDWDLMADNIAFFSDTAPYVAPDSTDPGPKTDVERLDLMAFVLGNIGRKGVDRGELGFLKPVIRKEFLQANKLTYDTGLRLGEDYDLYVRCLRQGARFLLSRKIGYAARVREDSLSSRHSAADIQALLNASERHIDEARGLPLERGAMQALHRALRKRFLLHAFLERKASDGLGAALAFAFQPPTNFPPIVRGVLRDKLKALLGVKSESPVGRNLLPPAPKV